MLKRLLFVDDEVLVLDGLRRALHGMRQEWDMTFVESAAQALQTLKSVPIDAVISDMRMPQMDGARLLELVKLRHPDVIRIVLSGQSSKETVLRSIAPAHQFLSKPCDPKDLKNRLGQAFAMRDLLSQSALQKIVARLRSIPSLPVFYDELTAELQRENTSLTRIEKIISKDVGMAAKILQLANSAFIGARTQVTSLGRAISLIGTETIRTLVLSVHVFSQFDRNSAVAAVLPAIWEHSVKVAGLAQEIARSQGCQKNVIEECFAAGLLHDVGRVILLAEVPKEYLELLSNMENPAATLRLEAEHWGCTHEQVGAYLLSIWGLPVPLVQTVLFHHRPMEAGEQQFSPLTAVHCADALVSMAGESPVMRDAELDVAYLDQLGLRDREAVWRRLWGGTNRAAAEGENA